MYEFPKSVNSGKILARSIESYNEIQRKIRGEYSGDLERKFGRNDSFLKKKSEFNSSEKHVKT